MWVKGEEPTGGWLSDTAELLSDITDRVIRYTRGINQLAQIARLEPSNQAKHPAATAIFDSKKPSTRAEPRSKEHAYR